VGLLVQLEKFGMAQLVVPAAHIRPGKNELKKAFSYATHGLNLACLIFNFVAKTLLRTFWRRTAVW
jgi:hypothetical protein